MAGNTPGRAGTWHGLKHKQTPHIVHCHTDCGTPTTKRNNLNEIARLLQVLQP